MAWSDDKLTKKLSITFQELIFFIQINEKIALFHKMKMPKVSTFYWSNFCLENLNDWYLDTTWKRKKKTRSAYGTCYVSRLALKKFVKSQMVFCVIVCTIWPWENGKDWSVKFIYSEKATKFCEIFTLFLSLCSASQK